MTHFNFKLVLLFLLISKSRLKVNSKNESLERETEQGWMNPENIFEQDWETVPVRRHATLTSHHSGTLGKIRNTRSPLSKLHSWCRTFASLLEWKPNSSKLHLTSTPLSFTHHRAGSDDLCPFCNIQQQYIEQFLLH